MTDFVIGCTHFGHENIIRLANRPFENVREMNSVMIQRWNNVVGTKDTVYHLGDFSFRGDSPSTYLHKLNGRIIFIQGNHDPKDWGVNYLEVRHNKTKVVLFHYPIEEWNGWWNGAIHLHAHTHKPEFKSAERRGNVGADAIGFQPIRLEEAIERLQ